jgi:uncharacterized membrane protein
VNGRILNLLGWITTAAIFAATVGLVVTLVAKRRITMAVGRGDRVCFSEAAGNGSC